MDKTTKEQVNTSFEAPLWEELSDEAAAVCVGGAPGDFKKYLKGIVTRLLQGLWWGSLT